MADVFYAALFLSAAGLTQVAIAGQFVPFHRVISWLSCLTEAPLEPWPLLSLAKIVHGTEPAPKECKACPLQARKWIAAGKTGR